MNAFPHLHAEFNLISWLSKAIAARIKQWRAAEEKRLCVPAYVVMHDRAVMALAARRPENPRQLLEVDGMGPAKLEKFGRAILELCRSGTESEK